MVTRTCRALQLDSKPSAGSACHCGADTLSTVATDSGVCMVRSGMVYCVVYMVHC
jgi:hypothetical protein